VIFKFFGDLRGQNIEQQLVGFLFRCGKFGRALKHGVFEFHGRGFDRDGHFIEVPRDNAELIRTGVFDAVPVAAAADRDDAVEQAAHGRQQNAAKEERKEAHDDENHDELSEHKFGRGGVNVLSQFDEFDTH
jgi:hypothetical protein